MLRTERFNKKDLEYYDYIVEHKKNVMVAFNILMNVEASASINNTSLVNLSLNEAITLRKNILKHDLSKFSEDEFNAYRKSFFSTNEEEIDAMHMGISAKLMFELEFNSAWKHHYTWNPHHPEYWRDSTMPKLAMIEMILDWSAMSIKFKDCPLKYFLKKKSELIEEFGNSINYEYIETILKYLSIEIKLYLETENYNIFKYV